MHAERSRGGCIYGINFCPYFFGCGLSKASQNPLLCCVLSKLCKRQAATDLDGARGTGHGGAWLFVVRHAPLAFFLFPPLFETVHVLLWLSFTRIEPKSGPAHLLTFIHH
jgi:hypothetical protein